MSYNRGVSRGGIFKLDLKQNEEVTAKQTVDAATELYKNTLF